jgi:hypothetical protein
MKDLANTPTQIACGWRMYGDIARLSDLSGSEVVIDLLSGACTCDGHSLTPPLELALDAHAWMAERLSRDGVPDGTVQLATLTLRPVADERRRLTVDCSTSLTTTLGAFGSRDTARWHPGDVADMRDA